MNAIQKNIFVMRRDITTVISYPQGGNAVPIYLRLADWQIPSGSTARIYMRKPSGAEIYNDCVINGNIVQITVTTQMTAESGWVKSTLEIVNGTDILHSFEMTLDVQATSISDNAIESKDEFTALENLVAEADQAVKDAETATEAANTAAGTANTAAGAANTAAGTANTAAQAANTAAGTANTAAENADDAANLANTAAGAANTAASAANSAAQEANDAADAANAAAGGDISNKTVTFTEAAEDTDIASGDTIATLFGKILKRFNTLKTTIQTILTNIGNLANLATTDKSSLVGAVNELNEELHSVPDIERTVISLTEETYYQIQEDYTWYMVKNGICYFQVQIRCVSPKSSSDNYYPLSASMPRNALGDYLYYEAGNGIQYRINSTGIVRLSGGTADGSWNNIQGAYPVA